MANVNRQTAPLNDLDTMYVSSHFTLDVASTEITSTTTDSGTVAVNDGLGGIITLTPSDGTVADNDEVYIATANQLFQFAVNRPIFGICRLKFTETASGIYNAAFGFMNSVGANSIIDDGGGVKVSGSTLAIHKIDGETVWRCTSSCNGVSTTTKSTKTATSTDFQVLEIDCVDANDNSNMTVCYYVNDEPLRDSTGARIRHSVPIANSALMSMWAGAKLGAITNNDLLLVDYWHGQQSIRSTNLAFVS